MGLDDLFYPDNPNRRRRAGELRDDAQSAAMQYNDAKRTLIRTLEPLHDRIEGIFKQFNFDNYNNLDQAVLHNATGQVLEDWNKVRVKLDVADRVDSVLWVTCGIFSLSGFAVGSLFGVFTYGAGSIVGKAAMDEVSIMSPVLEVGFDIASGAIARAQLRKAIIKLFEARLKLRQLARHAHAVQELLPIIKMLFVILEETGRVNQNIVELIMDNHSVRAEELSYYEIARQLNEMDRDRGSWTNEDPNWESVAYELDNASHHEIRRAPLLASAATVDSPYSIFTSSIVETPGSFLFKDYAVPHDSGIPPLQEFTNETDLEVIISPVNHSTGAVPFFDTPVKLHVNRTISEHSALVSIAGDESFILHVLGVINGEIEAVLLLPNIPTRCVLPDGSVGVDKELGKLHIRLA